MQTQLLRSLQLSIYLSIRYNDIEVFKTLLPSVPLNETFPNGNTLLQEVIRHKRTDMVYLLLQSGQTINSEAFNYLYPVPAAPIKQDYYLPPRSISM
jgi:ankyrin repeat protein